MHEFLRFAGMRFFSLAARQSAVPLRIALFGTDNFTVSSLKALHRYKLANPREIEALDVITRPPKAAGRGLKHLKEAPAALYAFDNGLTVRRAESSQDIIDLASHDYNLAVAVSYGKLIPAEFLNRVQFGGLNVHPSLLPTLSGPAPLHRALLNCHKFTGVTIQTLHPTKFDRGRILSHSREVAIDSEETVSSLEEKLGLMGADALSQVIADRTFQDPTWIAPTAEKYPRSYAGKLSPADRIINFDRLSLSEILVRYRVLGRLLAFQRVDVTKRSSVTSKRLYLDSLDDASQLLPEETVRSLTSMETGSYDIVNMGPNSKIFVLKLREGLLASSMLLLEGFAPQTPEQFELSMRKRGISSKVLAENPSDHGE